MLFIYLILYLIFAVNANLQNNIQLYNSGMVSKSDVRFQYATRRHFSSDKIKIEMISNKTGLFRAMTRSGRTDVKEA